MAVDRTNTDKFDLIPEGKYSFSVTERPGKYKTEKSSYRKWKLLADNGKTQKTITLVLFPWESKELLLALGGTLEGKEVVWDDEKVIGMSFNAKLNHSTYEQNGETKNKYLLTDFEEGIPF